MKHGHGQQKFLEAITNRLGAGATVVAKDAVKFAQDNGFSDSDHHWLYKEKYRIGRALYKLPSMLDTSVAMAADIVPLRRPEPVAAPVVDRPVAKKFDPNVVSEYEYAQVPERDKTYVAFGEFKLIRDIISSGRFFPVFISGHSGNGKTSYDSRPDV